ncbi:MAG: glycosyltransferase [Bryobacterales bacterium]
MRALAVALLEALFLLLVAPVLLFAGWLALSLIDLLSLFRSKRLNPDEAVRSRAVSVVIPTWNGKHHLQANLASVVSALEGNSDNEILIVENASEDGSAEWVRTAFPQVRVLALEENLGFGGGSNAGFAAAKNDIVVLLNNDMRVEPDFLGPLLDGFTDEKVFAVSAQIFFSDPAKRREETGLTRGMWGGRGFLLGHVIDERVDRLFPTFYAGGGSSAYDRRKFLELGGFDPLLHPFYVEDADISYMAWKRGWKVLYAPGSVVYHEHRGTIGKKFSAAYIARTIRKNQILTVWKNIHEPGKLAQHFVGLWGALLAHLLLGVGPMPGRPGPRAVLAAFGQLAQACGTRWRARGLAAVSDTEALRRPLGGYYRDRFAQLDPEPRELSVLMVSPYGIEPPIHGGAVFMNQTARHLAKLCRLHLYCMVDEERELASNQALDQVCASVELELRRSNGAPEAGVMQPYAVQQFWSREREWRLHRALYLSQADVLQVEYTQLACYRPAFDRIATVLFEHDVYFQSVARSLGRVPQTSLKAAYAFEYLRALRFERRALRGFDAVQVCTRANREYLESFAWNAPPIEEGYRAGIDVSRYAFTAENREPDTLLFVGNFKHPPNQAALEWFVREVFPLVRESRPQTRLIAVGAQAMGFRERLEGPGVEMVGEVDDIRDAMRQYAVFVAPILSGSGVRVKLLEAFAAGIPVVSTTIGAEGLAETSGEIVHISDEAEGFAAAALRLLADPTEAAALAVRARREVEERWDMARITCALEKRYRELVRGKRGNATATR